MNSTTQAAATSYRHAQEFLDHAAALVAKGAVEDSREVRMWRDFAHRKAWQGAQEEAGEVFCFDL